MLDVLEPLYEEAPDVGVNGGSKVGQRKSLTLSVSPERCWIGSPTMSTYWR